MQPENGELAYREIDFNSKRSYGETVTNKKVPKGVEQLKK